MSSSKDDPRFAKAKSDPRFAKISHNKSKLQIDSRFKALLTDSKFSSTHKVDKYGRPVQGKSREDMKRFYRLKDEEEVTSKPKPKPSTEKTKKEKETPVTEQDEIDATENQATAAALDAEEIKHDGEQEEGAEEDVEEEEFDQGEDEEEEESDDDDESSEEVAEEVVFEQEDVPAGDETPRFAVQNLDWDRVRAVDLLVLFQSFCPATGAVRSVTVYPSQFGMEKMKRDALLGPPKEIWADSVPPVEEESINDDADSSSATGNGIKSKATTKGSKQKGFSALKLRRYELEKLRYYYAVVECDSTATAAAIYSQCDGLEFEQSANLLDLRFIPEDMSFDQQPRDRATEVPSTYQPPHFATRALGSTNVELTWDADNSDRIQLTSAALKGSAREDDLRAFLASDSEEDDAAQAVDNEEKQAAVRNKYKALLDEIKGQEEEQENIQITFVPGLSESAAQLVEKSKQNTELGPWEAHLQKKKEEKKAKKKERKAAAQVKAEQPVSREDRDAAAAEEKRRAAELELLMLDTQGSSKKGFKLDSMLDEDDKKKKKGKKQRLKEKSSTAKNEKEAAAFKVNVADPRINALFTDPKFAIDPTSSHFKKTEGMKQLLAEKRKRSRALEDSDTLRPIMAETATASRVASADLNSLVDSIKRKGKKQK